MKPNHAIYMQRALKLALRGQGRVSPNPCVGCVIVKNGKVIAEGYHSHFGALHAEASALKKAKSAAQGADMYVNLEPCSHWGKTGPCAPLIIQSGIKRVFISMTDPFPKVQGKGIRMLKKAGISTYVGLENKTAREINRPFLTWATQRRPFIIYKTALSLDGKTATKTFDTRWISSPAARNWVHRLRSQCDAILIGKTTAQKDNPRLTSHGSGRNPIRILIDSKLSTQPSLNLFNTKDAKTIVITGPHPNRNRLNTLERQGVTVLKSPLKNGKIDLRHTLTSLAKLNIGIMLLEGGGETAWHFVQGGFVDEYYFVIAPKLIGGQKAPTPLGGDGFDKLGKTQQLRFLSAQNLGDDVLICAVPTGKGVR